MSCVMWECDFEKILKETPALRELMEELDLQKHFDPHDAFYGGRTNAVKLYDEATKNIKIAYSDICSLYPMTLKNDEYPAGIPRVIVNPGSTDIGSYFGLIQCKVSPPRKFIILVSHTVVTES